MRAAPVAGNISSFLAAETAFHTARMGLTADERRKIEKEAQLCTTMIYGGTNIFAALPTLVGNNLLLLLLLSTFSALAADSMLFGLWYPWQVNVQYDCLWFGARNCLTDAYANCTADTLPSALLLLHQGYSYFRHIGPAILKGSWLCVHLPSWLQLLRRSSQKRTVPQRPTRDPVRGNGSLLTSHSAGLPPAAYLRYCSVISCSGQGSDRPTKTASHSAPMRQSMLHAVPFTELRCNAALGGDRMTCCVSGRQRLHLFP